MESAGNGLDSPLRLGRRKMRNASAPIQVPYFYYETIDCEPIIVLYARVDIAHVRNCEVPKCNYRFRTLKAMDWRLCVSRGDFREILGFARPGGV